MADLSLLSPEQQALVRATVQNIEAHHLQLSLVRYLSVAGAIIALLEFTSGFSEELQLIWKGRPGLERNTFLIHRCIVLVGLLCAVQMSAGLTWTMSDFDCRALIGVVGILAAISICLADGLVMLEVWQLWECNTKVMRYMLAAYSAECVGTLCFLTVTVYHIITQPQGFVYQNLVQSCILNFTPRWLTGSWACGLAFELCMLISMFLNVLDKPRSAHMRLTRLLVRDGFVYFLGVISLRTLNLVIAATSPPATFFIPTFCSWALVTVLVNRLVVNQCRERHRLRQSIHFKADLTPLDLLCTPTATQHNEDLELSAMSVGVNVDVIQETRSVRSLRSLRSLRSVTSIHL